MKKQELKNASIMLLVWNYIKDIEIEGKANHNDRVWLAIARKVSNYVEKYRTPKNVKVVCDLTNKIIDMSDKSGKKVIYPMVGIYLLNNLIENKNIKIGISLDAINQAVDYMYDLIKADFSKKMENPNSHFMKSKQYSLKMSDVLYENFLKIEV
jgi:hypothetical protein